MSHTLPDLASVPDVDGRPFAEVFAARFAPLRAHEREHGTWRPKRIVEADELMRRAGLAGRAFGRERGLDVERDDDGAGPYLAISVRNGGYEPMCFGDGADDCGTCNACIQWRIPDYPGYVYSQHEGGDSRHYFALPTLEADEQLPGVNDEHGELGALADALERVERRVIVPWYFLTSKHERRSHMAWGNLGPGDDTGRITRLRGEIETARERIEAIETAMAAVPMPSEQPAPRKRRKMSSSGKPLRTMEAVPVRSIDVEYKALCQIRERVRRGAVVPDELDMLATTAGLDPATVAELTSTAVSMRRVRSDAERRDAVRLSEAEYATTMARIDAPGRIEALGAQIESTERQIAGLETKIARSRDANWRNWPGTSHDEYAAWMVANGYEVGSAGA